ncbi:MAG: leucine-rich repeat domain-containing protein, partial [Clostridiales bacterium]|nr:leucine-rich repeat domain-containing protein [Clostridiales bacterium]
AFKKCAVTSVNLANVQYIGANAFGGAALSSVNLSAAIEIGDKAFGNSFLKEATVPANSGLRYIGAEVFRGCTELDPSAVLNNATLLEYIGDYAFYKVGSALALQQQSLNIPVTVKYIGESAFRDASLYGGLNIYGARGSVLESIGAHAFRGTKIAGRVSVPSTVKSIGDYAFAELKGIDELFFATGSALEYIGHDAFYASGISGDLIIPDSVTFIGNMAFASCTRLKSVYIGAGVVELGSKAFSMAGISEVNFSDNSSLDTIGSEAFKQCGNLLKITIPATVTRIDRRAFAYARALTEVTMSGGVPPALGVSVFYGTESLNVIYVPAGKNEKGFPFINVYSLPTPTNVPDGSFRDGMSRWADYVNLLKVK